MTPAKKGSTMSPKKKADRKKKMVGKAADKAMFSY